jgi:hypothetical protein
MSRARGILTARRLGGRVDGADVRFCPVCGAPTEAVEVHRNAVTRVEMKKRRPRVLGLPMDRFARERAQPEEKQIRALSGLIRAARARGNQIGWAFKVWEAKYGRKVTPAIKREAMRLA